MIKRSLIKLIPTSPPADLSPQLPKTAAIAITLDGFGLAEILGQKLVALGYPVQVGETLPASCDVAVILDAFQPFDSQDSAIAINEKIFSHVHQIADHFSANGGRLIAVEDTGGQFATTPTFVYAPWAAGVSGLIKTAAQEWPKSACSVIDLQRADQTLEKLAERLLPEILGKVAEKEIGLPADGRRTCMDLVEKAASNHDLPLQENDVVLVTGGARGVTAACLIELAKKIRLRFILLGRTALADTPRFCQQAQTEAELKQALFSHYQQNNITITPKEIQAQITTIIGNREIQQTIDTLESLKSAVIYLPVDVLNYNALKKSLEDVRAVWGNISAAVHGAGVLADKLIAQKTLEQFRKVFSTKVIGLKNIFMVTEQDTLKLLVLFSSVAGRFGNPGQCDYAMANEILNKVAQQYQREHKHCVVKSINWGPWESGMVTPQLKQLFEQRGVALVPMEVGTKIFVEEIASIDGQVEIIIGGTLMPESKETHVQEISSDTLFSVNHQTHPYLASHTVKDVVVLPACLALEWFVQTAKQYFPDMNTISIKNFRVLRGIQLKNFDQQSYSFLVKRTEKNSAVNLILVSSDAPQQPHYSADVIINQKNMRPTFQQNNSYMQAWPYDVHQIYGDSFHQGILFHGKDFHAITQLDKISEQGATATINGLKSMSWPGVWQTDALAFDAIFQLGILWGVHMTGKQNLPSAVEKIQIYEASCPEDALYCTLFNAQLQGSRIVYDALLQYPDGRVYAALTGAEGVCYDI